MVLATGLVLVVVVETLLQNGRLAIVRVVVVEVVVVMEVVVVVEVVVVELEARGRFQKGRLASRLGQV